MVRLSKISSLRRQHKITGLKYLFLRLLYTFFWFAFGFISAFLVVNRDTLQLPANNHLPDKKISADSWQPQTHPVETDGNITATTANKITTSLLADLHTDDVADLLSKSVRILCMVLTTKKYHESRASYIKKTWGRRCTQLIFISDKNDTMLQAISFSDKTDYGHLWSKVRTAFRWAYNKHLKDFDWFMKADDDSYVILENLRALLLDHNPNDPHYFGFPYEPKGWTQPKTYTAGACYVLSRRSLSMVVEGSFSVPKYCKKITAKVAEDAEMGRCLQHVGITPDEQRDEFGLNRFFPFSVPYVIWNGTSPKDMWIWKRTKHYSEGENCCSSTAIAFHYVKPAKNLLEMEYLIYRLQPFGHGISSGKRLNRTTNKKLKSDNHPFFQAYKEIQNTLKRNHYKLS